MGGPEAIDTKFAHVHSESVRWWLYVSCGSGYMQCCNVYVYPCACVCVYSAYIYMCVVRCDVSWSLSQFSIMCHK